MRRMLKKSRCCRPCFHLRPFIVDEKHRIAVSLHWRFSEIPKDQIMKWIIGLSALIAMAAQTGHAQSSQCYAIKNGDLKNECLAITSQNPSKCYAIKDSDIKNNCLARVNNKKHNCYSIKDKDQKNRCLAYF
jgi:hypothetical protein